MRRVFAVSLLLAAVTAGATAPLHAQDNKCHIICAPVFVGQPGLVVTNALNKPVLDGAGNTAPTATHFLLRFTTVLPTQLNRVALVALVQWTPENKTDLPNGGTTPNANAPAFVYGPVISLFNAGPLNISIDALGVYQPGGTASAYHTTFNMEGIAGLSLGHMLKMMNGGHDAPPYLRGVAINALYDQQLTDVAPDFSGNKRHTPALLFLLTLPISPLP